jgi:hypothetical protein
LRRHTTHTRDAALRQLHRANRWVIAGSVLLTGVLADVAANAFPGKTIKHAGSARARAKHTGTASAKTSTGVLKPPAEAPKASESSGAPSAESAPAEETAPAQESTPAQESAPSQEAPAQESAPAQKSAPAQEAAPAQETTEPTVSGGS